MQKWREELTHWFNTYYNSFNSLTEEHKRNFEIKKDHSFRVAELSAALGDKLGFDEEEMKLAWFTGLFHDIGRFRQLAEYGTFYDVKSVDHAELSVEILKGSDVINKIPDSNTDIVLSAISNHNKLRVDEKIEGRGLHFARLLRDADKLDILKVLTDYYSNPKAVPNHTLTWEMPKGDDVSKAVEKEILAGKQVSKNNVTSEIDIKVMQMSWIFDLNFKPAVEKVLNNRFLEIIFKTLPKNDRVIEIYRKVKMHAENRLFNN